MGPGEAFLAFILGVIVLAFIAAVVRDSLRSNRIIPAKWSGLVFFGIFLVLFLAYAGACES